MKPNEVLAKWGYEADCQSLLIDSHNELIELSPSEARKYIDIDDGLLDEDCIIFLGSEIVGSTIGTRKIRVQKMGNKVPLRNVSLCIEQNVVGLRIHIGGCNNRVYVGRLGYSFNANVVIWNNSDLLIGDRSTSNGAQIILADSTILIGYDGMFSHEVVLQSSDQHGIVDLAEKAVVNGTHKVMRIGRHVWLGRRAMIMPGCSIAEGCVIGAGAIVTNDTDSYSIYAGVPAKLVRSNATWSRSPTQLSDEERRLYCMWE